MAITFLFRMMARVSGADGSFTLYEDDGMTKDYEKGQCSRITFLWDDARHQLTINKREGKYHGMLNRRTFHVTFANDTRYVCDYHGKKITITIP